jgi:predicted nucleic acid-binding protein
MNDKPTFVDSNVWLYALIQSDKAKHRVAKEAVRRIKSLIVSSQVISEVCVNMLKKAGRKESFIRELVSSFQHGLLIEDRLKIVNPFV